MRITVAVFAILALVVVSWADNPGIKARITNRGLDLVLKRAIASAIKRVDTKSIPLRTDSKGVFLTEGRRKYLRPKLQSGSFGSASLRTVSNSLLRLKVRDAEVSIAADEDNPRRSWLSNVDLNFYYLEIDLDLTITGTNGQLQVMYKRCKNVGLFLKNRNIYIGELCELAKKFVEGRLNKEIGKATSPATIWKGPTDYYLPKVLTYFKNYVGKYLKLELMYEFAKTTSYGTDYVDVYLTGDVYQDGKNTVKQFTPAAFPANAPVNKMLYFWLSEAVFNNIFNVAHDVQIFKTKIGKTEIKTAAAPKASFKKSGVSFRVTCDILITYPIIGTTSTKSASMEVNVDATLKLKGKTVTTAVSSKSSKFNDIEEFESVTPQMEAVAVKFVTEKLTPIKLPLPDYLELLNGVITPMDVSYNIRARYGPF